MVDVIQPCLVCQVKELEAGQDACSLSHKSSSKLGTLRILKLIQGSKAGLGGNLKTVRRGGALP